MRRQRWTPALIVGTLGLLLAPADGQSQQQRRLPQQQQQQRQQQPQGQGFDSREALQRYYDQEFEELNRRRIADLIALAGRLDGEEAELAYQDALNHALAFEQFEEGEPAAEAYLQRDEGNGNPRLRDLATFIKALALADREQHPEALKLIALYLNEPDGEDQPELGQQRAFTVGEAFLQRLIDSHLYDTAREVADLLAQSEDPEVQEYFEARRDRLALLGEPAPPIQARDVDGQAVNLSQMQGQVVLVSFWASWAPPSLSLVPRLKSLIQEFGEDRFQVLGVNVDQAQEDVDAEEAESNVRRFLVDFRVTWPNIVEGADEVVEAYRVTEIPANFLIDENGRITHVELSGEHLERAVREALGEEAGAASTPEAPREEAVPVNPDGQAPGQPSPAPRPRDP